MDSEAVRYSAEMLGITLQCRHRDYDSEYPFEIFYMFDGIKIMAIESEEVYMMNGAVE